jgi:hypothetical protein
MTTAGHIFISYCAGDFVPVVRRAGRDVKDVHIISAFIVASLFSDYTVSSIEEASLNEV